MGHAPFLLSPGEYKVLFVLKKLFSQSCVSYFEALKEATMNVAQDFKLKNSFSFSMFARVFPVDLSID